jgi:hypothetical protein
MSRTVVFPDGTLVTGAAIAARLEDKPDFGLYAYGHELRRATRRGRLLNRLARRGLHGGSWEPPWEVEWLHWPDFGVPADGEQAAASIVRAFARARAGDRVEVRCYGGQGRTGTMLACMAILAGVPAPRAVDWVRTEYSPHAVEREGQREWVSWFATWSSQSQIPAPRLTD